MRNKIKIMSNKINILIRCDSSSTIGLGHTKRDLVLANQYKNSNITFAAQNLKGNINKEISKKYKVKILKSNDINELISLINKKSYELVIIDSYTITYEDEKKIKDNTKCELMVFDDTYEKHYCDILLNHNISANEKRYKNLVPANCELRCGSKYTLLRNEFIIEKEKLEKTIKKVRKKTRVFIAMGGSDHSNENIRILKALKDFKQLKINIVTTKANANLKELKKYCSKKKRIKLFINSNKIAKLMRKSDFAIVSPSVTMNEIYFMNIPFLVIKTANNQKDMYDYLCKCDLFYFHFLHDCFSSVLNI